MAENCTFEIEILVAVKNTEWGHKTVVHTGKQAKES